MTKKAQPFLCYAKEDKVIVEQLYSKLEDKGFDPWLDTKKLLAGQEWEYIIEQAIRDSDFFIACLSENSVTKDGFLNVEIKKALRVWEEKAEGKIYLIPVRLEDCSVPSRLSHLHWVDLFTEEGFDNLLDALKNQSNSEKDKVDLCLINAAKVGNNETVLNLLDEGIGINLKDENGVTALMWAVKNGQVKTVKLLLNKCAKIDLKDHKGRTSLMMAAYNGNIEILQILLNCYADTELKDYQGKTALIIAKGRGYGEVVKLLEQAEHEYIIYSDTLRNGWENWSWDCRSNLKSTEYVHNGKYSISAELNRHGGLALACKKGISTKGYNTLGFFINGGEKGKQKLKVYFHDSTENGIRTPISLDKKNIAGGTVSPKKWKLVTIPLEELGAVNTTIFKISISDISGVDSPAFYVDEIKLIADYP